MAETFTPESPRPTRKQIWAIFGSDPDFAKKVEKIFDDLLKAAEAGNANAAEIEEIHAARPDESPRIKGLERHVEELEARLAVAERSARRVDELARLFNEFRDYAVAA